MKSSATKSLELTEARRVDQACESFEAAWQSGPRPRIEAYLAEASERMQPVLIAELVALEAELRRAAGEEPTVEEYLVRFPDQAPRIEALFRDAPGPDETASENAGSSREAADDTPAQVLQGPNDSTETRSRYRLVRFHAKGGLGEVHVAEDGELRRRVALKRIQRAHADDPESRRRFLREAEITARLEHPGIVPIYGLAQDADGQPYYAMRFIEGVSLKDAIARFHRPSASPVASAPGDYQSLEFRQLLGSFVTVCKTLAYAHSRGVVHRDLKPANIMLGEYGETLVVDWGLAKAAWGDDGPATEEADPDPRKRAATNEADTQPGKLMGTALYMSPEQAAGQWDVVGPASDIYSLGATLYELLTGHPPYRGGSVEEVVEQVKQGNFSPPRQHKNDLPRPLEAICRKAMARKSEERYATALDLAAEVEHWLADEPVAAYREPLTRRMGRWVRKHRTLVGTSAALAAVVLTIVIAWVLVAAAREREDVAQGLRQQAETAAQAEKQANQALQQAREELDRAHYIHRINLVQRDWEAGDAVRARNLLADCDEKHRHWEWHYLSRVVRPALAMLKGHASPVNHLTFSPDGRRLASASIDGTVRLWDADDGKELATLKGNTGLATHVAFSPDGRRLASADDVVGTVRLWEVESGKELATLQGLTGRVYRVSFSPDGRRLASASDDGTVRLWRTDTGEELAVLKVRVGRSHHIAFSPDGRLLTSASDDGTVRLWEANSGKELAALKGLAGGDDKGRATLEPYSDGGDRVSFSPDGRRLASASSDRTVRLWEVESGKELATLQGHANTIHHVAFSPDGWRLASASSDRTVRLWEVESGKELATLQGHTGRVYRVSFSLDGRRLASASDDGTVRLWRTDTGEELAVLKVRVGWSHRIAFSPDGRRLASSDEDDTVWLWAADSGKELVTLEGHVSRVNHVSFSPDGCRLASAGFDGTVRLWETVSGKELTILKGHTGSVTQVAFSSDGRRLASASRDGTARLWDVESGKELATLKGHAGPVSRVVISPSGRRIISAGSDGTVRLWETDSAKELATLKGYRPGLGLFHVPFSPDGRRLASASDDGTVRLWEVESGKELATLKGHTARVSKVSFSPDGRRIALESSDGRIRLWDVDDRKELATLKRRGFSLGSVSFSPDGRRIASGGTDRTTKLWEVESGKELATLKGHVGRFTYLAFSPDGRRLASADDRSTTIHLWTTDNGQELATLQGHTKGVFHVVFSPDGRRLASACGDGTVRLWITQETPEEMARRRQVGRELEAEECEKSGHWFAAAFHLRQFIKDAPADPALRLRHAAACAHLGRWRDAAADLVRACQLLSRKR